MRLVPESVCIVGMGGLGCPASLALARAGVRHLTLVDGDCVELSNLHRQPWHRHEDIGVPKVMSAQRKLAALFPSIQIDVREEMVTAENAEAVFRRADLVIDATDGIDTKFMLSDAAVATKVPLIYGGVVRFDGLVMRIDPNGACLRCLFEEPPTRAPTCAQAGVLGSMAALVGAVQAQLACEQPTKDGGGRLHILDGKTLTFRSIAVRRRADCSACSPKPPFNVTLSELRQQMPALTTIDVQREQCPMTYVRVKLGLQALPAGALALIVLRGEQPKQNVPQSAREDGHEVISLVDHPDGRTEIVVRVAGG